MKPGVLLVRADATTGSGTGHVMRCLALAQAWQHAGGEVIFAMAQSTAAIAERLRSEPVKIVAIEAVPGSAEDVRQTIAATGLHNAAWVVLDGYRFDANYVAELQNVRPVLVIDDLGEIEFYSSALVLNQNLHARPEIYAKRAPRTRLLLGPDYTLLRKEFAAYRNWARKTKIEERATKILITIGGSDPKGLTPRILSALAGLPVDGLQIRVVVGGSAENRREVSEKAERFSGRVEVFSDVSNMAHLMAWADVAVAGAGTTCWEMCLLGVPAILVVVAENQRFIAEHLAELGAAFNAGSAESLDCRSLAQITADLLENKDRRVAMSQSARQLVDGLGAERVRAALLNRELILRSASESDCRLLFLLANDPLARAASFHGAPISWEDHTRWFTERLQDPQTVIYIGESSAGEAIGVVRIQIKGESAVLSINVASDSRGQGWGRELIVLSTNSLLRARLIRRVDALIKPGNQASVRLFEASGFRRAGMETVAGQDAMVFSLECGSGDKCLSTS